MSAIATRSLFYLRKFYNLLHTGNAISTSPTFVGTEITEATLTTLATCANAGDCTSVEATKIAVCDLLTLNTNNVEIEGDAVVLVDAASILANDATLVTPIPPAPARRLLESLRSIASINPSRILQTEAEKGYIAAQSADGGMTITITTPKSKSSLIMKVSFALISVIAIFF